MLKNAGLQGSSYPFGHCMTTGFIPFELPTFGLLQRGWDHCPPSKACLDLKNPALGWHSQCYEYTVTKQIVGGAQWVELL